MKLVSFQLKKGDTLPPQHSSLDSPSTAVFLFGAPELMSEPGRFEQIQQAYPRSIIVGCSSAGEIFGAGVFDRSLSVAVAKFERTQVRTASVPIASNEGSFSAGQKLAEQLQAADLKGLFILTDGLCVNGSQLIRGINSIAKNAVITGGLAGDGPRFQSTWVIHQGRPVTGYATAVAFYGPNIQIGHGSQGGWDIFGPERLVTRSAGNMLFELDGKPALDIYKEYLGELAAGLPSTALLFPLQIRAAGDNQRKIVRTILSVDEDKKAMVFAGDIPQGALAQLMRANFDRLIDGAAGAAHLTTSANTAADETLALAISCVGRRLVLGERTYEEVEAALERMPQGTQQVGFYSYGEISPYVQGESCELHNQTMTLTTLSEKKAA